MVLSVLLLPGSLALRGVSDLGTALSLGGPFEAFLSPPDLVGLEGVVAEVLRDLDHDGLGSPDPLRVPVGGILSRFAEAWERESADPWVTSVIRIGYSIPFVRPPPLSKSPVSLTAYSPGSEKYAVLEAEVSSMLLKG